MIEVKNKQIVINGQPKIIMAGEIHYFRLHKEDWQDRINKLKAAGYNTVSSYVPWLCHEYVEGEVDLTGKTRPELDLATFIDMCKESGLYFFLRPGPFIMAEMKNEGIPYWVYKKYPEVIPVGWDGNPATTKTLDYLAPNFLKAAHNWYKALAEVIAPRLYTNNGNIIGIQLDNEIGMLSWVSNTPDLTENVLTDFAEYVNKKYDEKTLKDRYPFDLKNSKIRAEAIRSPKENYAAKLLKDLGYYMRNRFARYVSELRSYFEQSGVKDVPFIINIHGTGGGRGLTFPIGISQLYETYTQDSGYISGSDIYFGDLDMACFQDLYIINGFMDSVHTKDQPLTSVEFNCGDSNFGEMYSGRNDPSATDFKARMCIAQGNRMLNYYLFTGGINYRLDEKLNDGNNRIAFTGGRHGFAAPINPEGEYNYTFPRMARGMKAIMAVKDKLAIMNEEHDDVAFAFIPDYYMTEYHYPKSKKMNEIVKNIEANRTGCAWEVMGRAMLLAGYRFTAMDVQNKPTSEWTTSVIALPSARYMDSSIQKKLADYLAAGGNILLCGEVPLYDMEGKPCTILADALKVKVLGTRSESQFYYQSVYADGWAAPRPEIRSGFAQIFEVNNAEPLMRIYGTDEICSFDVKCGKGRAIVIAHQYRCDIDLIKTALEKLGAKASLTHDYKNHGIFMTSSANNANERFIHILNLDGLDKEFHVYDNGKVLFEGRKILLQNRDGVMLPVNVNYNDITIKYSTAEIMAVKNASIEFRLTQKQDVIALNTNRQVLPSDDYEVKTEGNTTLVVSKKHAKIDDYLIIKFA